MINSSMIDETITRQSKFALKLPGVQVYQYSVVVIAAGAAGAAGAVIPANAATIANAYNNIYILYLVLLARLFEPIFDKRADIIRHSLTYVIFKFFYYLFFNRLANR